MLLDEEATYYEFSADYAFQSTNTVFKLLAPACSARGRLLGLLGASLVCKAAAMDLPKYETPQETLKRLGQEPKPSLGQNFLLDQQVVIDTIKAGNIQPGDHVIEVGPGTGMLTRGLLEAGARVTAVEKDKSLAEALGKQFKDYPQLQVQLASRSCTPARAIQILL
eukprot:6981891-Pyramimonas_sp.AAC.2